MILQGEDERRIARALLRGDFVSVFAIPLSLRVLLGSSLHIPFMATAGKLDLASPVAKEMKKAVRQTDMNRHAVRTGE